MCTYCCSLSFMPKPFLHCLLPYSWILATTVFFHTFLSYFIPSNAIPSLLIFLSHIKFTSSHIPNLSQTRLHLAHHLDLYPTSIRYALPISDTRLSSYTILSSQSTIHFTFLSTNEFHPDSPLTSSFCCFPTFHSHLPNPFCILSVYSPFSNRVGLPLHNIPSPFPSVMDICFVDLKFCHIRFYTL